MNCLSQVRWYVTVAVFKKTIQTIPGSLLNPCYCPYWKNNFKILGIGEAELRFLPTQFQVHCYSTRRKAARSKPDPVIRVSENEKDAFFVVRKGDIVGIYKNLSDCQAQVGSSVFDPPVSVYKGYSLTKYAEEYLASCGLKNPSYSIKASDFKDDLFGMLKPCLFQEPASSEVKTDVEETTSRKSSKDTLEDENGGEIASTSIKFDPLKMLAELEPQADTAAEVSDSRSCVIEFDGASKGNPGLAGAAAVLKTEDGSLICKLRQGLGIATSNAAEYQGVILGLKYALKNGYRNIRVKGDSKLVCMQMQGLWRVRHKAISQLYDEAKELRDKCLSFQISHVLREFNSVADAQANLAARLDEGQVQMD